MNALTQHYIRKAALEVKAHNPAADVYVPEEPEWKDVVDAKTLSLLSECSSESTAELYADVFEVLGQRRSEIIFRAADAWAAINRGWQHDANEARKDELAALGADVLRMVTEDLRKFAEFELEREK
ncbi:MAG: hypothetical protein ACRCV5_19010 [Afipia sp.]